MSEEEQQLGKKKAPQTQYELIRDFIEIREDGIHCRIEEYACNYVQKVFRTSNFIRHFRNEHTRASVEHGMFQQSQNKKKRKANRPPRPNSVRPVEQRCQVLLEADRAEEFVVESGEGLFHCNIAPESECPYQLRQFRKHHFMRHFVARHPKKAREHGLSFALFKPRKWKVKGSRRVERRVEEEVEECVDAPAMDIDATVQNHIESSGEKYLCRISAGGGFCFYFQTQFNSHNFYRHFYTVHPQEAEEKGISREAYLNIVNGTQQVPVERPPTIFKVTSETETIFVKEESFAAEEDSSASVSYSEGQEEDHQRKISFGKLADLLEGYTRKKGHVTYCTIDDGTGCSYYTVNFRYNNFARHIRLRHMEEARQIGLFNQVPKRQRRPPVRVRDTKEDKKRKRLCDLVRDNVRLEGDHAYCQINVQSGCNFSQMHFNVSNFSRHFRVKHPDEAEDKGFMKRNTRRKSKQGICSDKQTPADRVKGFIVRRLGGSGRAGYLCNIEPDSGCSYYEPFLGGQAKDRLVSHFLRKHPEEAEEHQFVCTEEASVGSDVPKRTRVKRPHTVRNLVDRWVIRKGLGARCNILPGTSCLYTQKVYTPFNFARHFYNKHPRMFQEHGFTLCMIGLSSKISKSKLTKPPQDVLIKEELDISEEPEECFDIKIEESMAVDEIPAIKQEYDPLTETLDEATQESIEDETEESFNDSVCDYLESHEDQDETDQVGKQKSLVEMVEECVREVRDLTFCNIDGVPGCPYSQRNFNAHNFARHFRSMHHDEAGRKGFYEYFSRKAPSRGSLGVIKKSARMYRRQLSHREMVSKHTKEDANGVHCRIAGACKYVQKKFMVTNFERHFRAKHPREAMENGFNKEQKESDWRIKEKLHVQKFEQLWKECVEKDAHGGGYCRLVPGCTFYHRNFMRPRFRLHFFQMHNDEAVEKGFTEEQELDKFSGTSDEQNELIEQCVERREKGVFCSITEEDCSFQRDTFEPNHFLRHFLLIHPQEAGAKGVFKLGQPGRKSSVFGPFGNSTFQRMVFECTATDEDGIHCRIDITEDCPYSQSTFLLMDYLRHFRTVHTAQAKAKQFFRTAEEMAPRPGVFSTAIQKHVLETDHEVRCAISSSPCSFTRDSFASRTFLRHFCKSHPDEAEANEFYIEVERPAGEPCPEVSNEEQPEVDEPYVAYEDPLEEGIGLEDHDIKQQLSTPNEDPSKYCRLCFSISPPLQPVFNTPGDLALADQIATCTGIDLSAETEPNASICYECLQKLVEIQRFRQLCHTVDKVARPNNANVTTLSTTQDQPPKKVPIESSSEIPINHRPPLPMEEDDDQPSVPVASIDPSDDQSESHSFQCRECDQSFNSTQPIMQHYREQHADSQPLVFIRKSYKCNDCDTIVPDKSNLSDHRQQYHNPDVPPSERVFCTVPGVSTNLTTS